MQQSIVNSSKTLIEWVREYFEENKDALKLFGINSVDELQKRILEISKQYPTEKSKQLSNP